MTVRSGSAKSRLDGLKALRTKLADELDHPRYGEKGSPPIAALAKELRATLAEIEQLEAAKAKKASVVDELAKRRQAKGRVSSGRGAPVARGRRARAR